MNNFGIFSWNFMAIEDAWEFEVIYSIMYESAADIHPSVFIP
jgi:hypothetical protein